MESITGSSLLGVRKNTSGLWIQIIAPTAGMTIDTTADIFAAGCNCINTGDGKSYRNYGTSSSPTWIENSRQTATTLTASTTGTAPTSIIPDTVTFVSCTPATADANSIIVLPTPVVGKEIKILVNGTTGLELRSSSTTTIGINGGTGSAAESAVAANTLTHLLCVSATNWRGFSTQVTGTAVPLEIAAN